MYRKLVKNCAFNVSVCLDGLIECQKAQEFGGLGTVVGAGEGTLV